MNKTVQNSGKVRIALVVVLSILALVMLTIVGLIFLIGRDSTTKEAKDPAEYTDDQENHLIDPDETETDWKFSVSKEGAVQFFIGEPFYDGKISNEDEALDVIYSVLEDLDVAEGVELDIAAIDGPTSEGNTIYTFRQYADDIVVYGASVKLVTDGDQNAVGLNSTLIPVTFDSRKAVWTVDSDQAESIVSETLRAQGIDVEVLLGDSEQILLPYEDDPESYYYAWAIYTPNYFDDVCTGYVAHYVDSTGEYLYCNPVTSPGSIDARSGAGAALAFSGYEPDTWTQTVKKYHGDFEDVTIPVARDPQTGDVLLMDMDRMIMCADYRDFEYNDTITPRSASNGKFDDYEVLIYRTFIDIYDQFEMIGWKGPDGQGSPSLLLMGEVDEDGNPSENAAYFGKAMGFDFFTFDSTKPFGEAYDVIAHEYTHALTGTAMLTNLYINDYGAINEAMSDIFGNLIEAILGKTADKKWLINENGEYVFRSMSQPNDYEQPAYVWDKYYVPAVSQGSDYNDQGGVHTNSSLLNLIAYRLNESGMSLEDQLYYWQNVALVLTPRTDYEQIALILPWALKVIGMEQYTDVVRSAIKETRISDPTLPDTVENDLARFQIVFPDQEILDNYDVTASAYDIETENEYITWAEDETGLIALTVDSGYYMFTIELEDNETGEIFELVKTSDGWTVYSPEDLIYEDVSDDWIIYISKGEIIEFDPNELASLFYD